MIRLAVIGTSAITEKFLSAVSEVCDDMKPTAVYSRKEDTGKAFAEKHGLSKVFTSINELSQSPDIDAVYIASPNFLHFEHSIAMLSNGKHVLCEKPVASNSPELSLMREAAKKRKVVFMEAMRSVFDPGFALIKDNLIKLGKIRNVYFEYCQYSSRYDNFKNGVIENAFRPELSNGALMDIGVYCIHPMVKLFGLPQSVSAQAVKLVNGVDGAGTAILNYGDMLGVINYSKIADGENISHIQGENGVMLISKISEPCKITINYRNGKTETFERETQPNNMVYEAAYFQRLIQKNSPAKAELVASKAEMMVMDEIRKQTKIVFPSDI